MHSAGSAYSVRKFTNFWAITYFIRKKRLDALTRVLLGHKEALWPKKLEISHASQILTNDFQILVLSQLSNYYCNAKGHNCRT